MNYKMYFSRTASYWITNLIVTVKIWSLLSRLLNSCDRYLSLAPHIKTPLPFFLRTNARCFSLYNKSLKPFRSLVFTKSLTKPRTSQPYTTVSEHSALSIPSATLPQYLRAMCVYQPPIPPLLDYMYTCRFDINVSRPWGNCYFYLLMVPANFLFVFPKNSVYRHVVVWRY